MDVIIEKVDNSGIREEEMGDEVGGRATHKQ